MKRLILCLIAFASLATLRADENVRDSAKILFSPGGRFVFGQVSVVRADQFMLDTYTGRLWTVRVDPKTERPYLQTLLYESSEGLSVAPDGVTPDTVPTQRILSGKESQK